MKFIHVADTHLGKTEFKLKEREEDFYRAFKQVIDKAIEEKVDFVIHSGDLFDNARPPIRTIVFAVQQLKRLKEARIPFFVIAGSHDVGVGETILSVLDSTGMLKNLSERRYYEGMEVKGEFVGDVYVCGIYGKRAKIREIYKNLKATPRGKFNIFMFHHTISDINPKFADIEKSLLPKGFDYYAGGHWHGFFETKYDKGIVVYPGSTEYCDVREMQNDKEKYFVIYDNGEIRKIRIKTRGIKIIEINADEIENIPKGNGEILIIKIKGEVDRGEVFKIAKEKGYLYPKIYVIDEEEKTPWIDVSKSIDEMEKEYLEANNYTEEEIQIAKYLLKVLGEKLTPRELDEREKEVIKFLEERK